MRLDKFLKVSRLIKRRTVANSAADAGRVTLNGKMSKPGAQVKIGDRLAIAYGNQCLTVEILSVSEVKTKDSAAGMYAIISKNEVLESR